MVGHGGSSAGSYLSDPTSPIPSHCASIVATSTLRVKKFSMQLFHNSITGSNNALEENESSTILCSLIDFSQNEALKGSVVLEISFYHCRSAK